MVRKFFSNLFTISLSFMPVRKAIYRLKQKIVQAVIPRTFELFRPSSIPMRLATSKTKILRSPKNGVNDGVGRRFSADWWLSARQRNLPVRGIPNSYHRCLVISRDAPRGRRRELILNVVSN